MRVFLFCLLIVLMVQDAGALFASPPPKDYPYGPKSDWLSGGRIEASPATGFKTLSLTPAATELSGKPWKTLLILVDFPDVARKGSPAYFKDMLFAIHGSTATGKEPYPLTTMADMYERMSGGVLTFGDTTVVGWFEAPKPYTYYTRYDGSNNFEGCHGLGKLMNGADSGAQQLLALALDRAVAQNVNLEDFDNVKDAGFGGANYTPQPDGIFVVHAGPGGEQTSGSLPCKQGEPDAEGGDFWSHQYYVSYDGLIVHYLLGPAESASASSKTGLSAVGVWAHEFGHMLNLPDLYAPTTEVGVGVGCWDLMGYGIRSCWSSGYTGDDPGSDPQEMSVWTRAQLNWSAPRPVLDNVCNRKIEPVAYGGDTFKVTPDPKQPGDYFLVEYRAAVAMDQDLLPPNTSGERNRVCVWHIDDGVASAFQPNEVACHPNEDRVACKADHYGVSLVQPDGKYELEKGAAYASGGHCLAGPGQEMTSGPVSGAGTNYDLWPWEGAPVKHWTVRTGALLEQATVTILVNDDVQSVPPVIQGSGDYADRGKVWKFQPSVVEGAGTPLWSLLRYPAGMTIDTDTGLVTWRVPKSFKADKVLVELQVENCGGSDTHKFYLYISEEDDGFWRCGLSGRTGWRRSDGVPYLLLGLLWVALRVRRTRLRNAVVLQKHQ